MFQRQFFFHFLRVLCTPIKHFSVSLLNKLQVHTGWKIQKAGSLNARVLKNAKANNLSPKRVTITQKTTKKISNHTRDTAKRWCILQIPSCNMPSGQKPVETHSQLLTFTSASQKSLFLAPAFVCWSEHERPWMHVLGSLTSETSLHAIRK